MTKLVSLKLIPAPHPAAFSKDDGSWQK